MEQIVINGNNIDLLKNYPDNYFDAVVTDPPYGLGKEPDATELMKDWIEKGYHEISGSGFMGKEWDAFVPQPVFWKEVFRVLKHGGHVVAFYGTRTYDWGVMAMRFAGFEVRDCIQWLYGCLSDDTEILTRSGYIQYHKFIKLPNFREQDILIYDIENDIYKWEKPERWNQYNIHKDKCYRIKSDSTDQIVSRNHRCLVEREGKLVFIQAEMLSEMEFMPTLSNDLPFIQERYSEILQSSMQWNISRSRMEEVGQNRFGNIQFTKQPNEEGKYWRKEPILERGNNISEKERILFGSQIEVCEMPEGVYSNGKERWLCGGISVGYGETIEQTSIENGMRTSYRPQPNEQQYKQPNAIFNQQGTQTIRMGRSYSTTLATITPIEYSGVIFCPTVSTGCFVARRNGKIFITGNSGFPKSHNISKAIDKMPKANDRILEFAELLKQKRNEIGLSISEADVLICNGSTMYNFIEGRNINGFLKIYPPNKEHYEKIKTHFNIQGWDDIVENNLQVVGLEEGNFGFQSDGERWTEKREIKESTTDSAKKWEGWGSALKPSNEPIVLARKPLEKGLSIAENVLKWGTGGINIDGCRVGNEGATKRSHQSEYPKKENGTEDRSGHWARVGHEIEELNKGRFPANLILTHHPECECKGLKKVKGMIDKPTNRTETGNTWDEENSGLRKNMPKNSGGYADENGEETIEDWDCHEDCPIRIMDEQSGVLKSGKLVGEYNGFGNNGIYGKSGTSNRSYEGDKGGASRFFYCAKSSKSERNKGLEGFEQKENKHSTYGIHSDEGLIHNGRNPENRSRTMSNFHPTVKPVKLMQYLVRMITPPNGKVLDPFCGSGTTGIACKIEGFEFVGMEQDPEYIKIAEARINNWVEEKGGKVQNKYNNQENTSITQTTLF